jgi:hypothetical protein
MASTILHRPPQIAGYWEDRPRQQRRRPRTRPTDVPADRPADRLPGRSAGRPTARPIGRQIDPTVGFYTHTCSFAGAQALHQSPGLAMLPQLVLQLFRLFAKGVLHATEVQRLASAAWEDGCWSQRDPIGEKLARAGSRGQRPGNIHRDVLRAAKAAGLLSEARPCRLMVPGPGQELTKASMLLPHEILHEAIARAGSLASFCLSAEQLASDHGLGPLLRQ